MISTSDVMRLLSAIFNWLSPLIDFVYSCATRTQLIREELYSKLSLLQHLQWHVHIKHVRCKLIFKLITSMKMSETKHIIPSSNENSRITTSILKILLSNWSESQVTSSKKVEVTRSGSSAPQWEPKTSAYYFMRPQQVYWFMLVDVLTIYTWQKIAIHNPLWIAINVCGGWYINLHVILYTVSKSLVLLILYGNYQFPQFEPCVSAGI